jgi:argininosuccinate lyase
MKLVRGDRLKPLDEEAVEFTSSINADREIIDAVIKVNTAHVLMLYNQGIITKDIAKNLLQALSSLNPKMKLNPELEDVHMNVEAEVMKIVGEDIGGWLNIGKSRNDQVATAIRITLRDKLLNFSSNLISLCKALLSVAEKNLDVIMPAYTHLQHAQPVTLAHYLIAYHDTFLRDLQRLKDCYKRVNLSPMGSAALATSTLPIDRKLTSELLGFNGIVENSIDAVSSRDFAIESAFCLATSMINMSRFCEELILWGTKEWGFVEIPDEFCSTSSIMPQKKNPVVTELIRAKASTSLGCFISTISIVKSLPLGYSLDLQELTPNLWCICEQAIKSSYLLAKIVNKLSFNKDKMIKEGNDEFLMATDVADYLASEKGLTFRKAHKLVGKAVKRALEGLNFDFAIVEEAKALGINISKDEIKEILNARRAVEKRKVEGGPSKELVSKMIEHRTVILDCILGWLNLERERLSKANENLMIMVKKLIKEGGESYEKSIM